MVIHILPEKESDEYEWMKSLAARFSLVRQGILVHNAINRFDNADLDEVLRWLIHFSHLFYNDVQECVSMDLSFVSQDLLEQRRVSVLLCYT